MMDMGQESGIATRILAQEMKILAALKGFR